MKGCRYSGADETLFFNTDDNSVRVEARDDRYFANAGLPTRNFIQNCVITRQGASSSHSAGIIGGECGEIYSHNLLQNFSASAMTPGGMEIIIEYNEFMGTPYGVEDMGALYTGGLAESDFTQIRYNYFHDSQTGPKHGQTVYLDAMGSYFAVYGNVMKNIPSALKSHTGVNNMWVNNVITELSNQTSGAVEIANGYYQGPFWTTGILDTYGLYAHHFRGLENYLDARHAARYPQQYRYLNDVFRYAYEKDQPGYTRGELEERLRTPSGYYFVNNLSYRHTAFNFLDYMYDTMLGYEQNWVAGDEDPGFKDFDGNDLSFREDAKVYEKLPGFEAPPFESMGLVRGGTRWEGFGIMNEPSPATPADGSSGKETYDKVAFKWTEAAGTGRYRLTVAKDPDFKNICLEKDTILTYAEARLPDLGAAYWWKVTALPLAKSLEPEPKESAASRFTVMSYEEMNAVANADKRHLTKEIEYVTALAETVEEGGEPGEWAPGTRGKMLAAAAAAREIRDASNIQPFIDDALADLKLKINELRPGRKPAFKPLTMFESADWHGGLNTPDDLISVKDGVMTVDSSTGDMRYAVNDQKLEPGILYTFRARAESIDGWLVFGNYKEPYSQFGRSDMYTIVVSGAIELQKYTASAAYYIVDSYPREGVVDDDGKWREYAFGVLPEANGARVIVMVDGKVVIDYKDTSDPLYYEGNLVTLSHKANKTLSVAPPQMTYTLSQLNIG
jgi:hypothetical protein